MVGLLDGWLPGGERERGKLDGKSRRGLNFKLNIRLIQSLAN